MHMNEFKIGNIIKFGNYSWIVLDIAYGKALIITEEIIGQHAYNDFFGNVTWADCALRKYLNGEFYDRFSDADKEKIVTVTNQTPNNPWYNSDGGIDTEDKIFLLTIEDVVCKYFGDSAKLLNNPSEKQKYWFQRKDENNIKRRARFGCGGWWWWLRSPGRANNRAVYIHGDGNVGIQGNGTYKYSSNTIHRETLSNEGGVRPALWLKID